MGWALLTAAWIDAQTYRLPDFLTLPLILAGLAMTWVAQPGALYNHAAAAMLGYASFRLLDWAYYHVRKRHGLGQGDAKLLAAGGAWAGLAALPYIVLTAGLLGIVMAMLMRPAGAQAERGGQIIAFGPALAASCFAWRLLAAAGAAPF